MTFPQSVMHLLLTVPFLGMVLPRLTGTHHHMFDNVLDVQPDDYENAPGDVFTLDEDLHPRWLPPGDVTSGSQDDAFIVAMAAAL